MSRSISLATLRDTITRLKRVRVICGKNDEENNQELLSTGDAFDDNINKFISEYKALGEFMAEREDNMKKFGNDRETIILSNDIRKKTTELKNILAEAKKILDAKELKMGKYNVQLSKGENKKIQKKHDILKKECDKCRSIYNKCLEEFELINSDKGEKDTKNISSLRYTIDRFKKRKFRANNEIDQMTQEEKLEYDNHMIEIKKNEEIIDKSLDRIKSGVDRIYETAINIGGELDNQNKMLDNTEIKMDTAKKDLRGVNRGLTKLMREQKPITLWLKISGVVFIISIVGFFLYQFNIV